MPSSEPSPYADLEIRIFEQQHDLYPVELTLDSGRVPSGIFECRHDAAGSARG